MKSHTLPIIFLALAIVCYGCSKKSASHQEHRSSWLMSSTIAINPSVPVYSLHSGMTVQEVVAQLGQPTLTNGSGLQFASLGLFISPHSHRYGLVAPFAGHTKEGIGLGASRADVIRAYGQPTASSVPKAGFELLSYDSVGIRFQLRADKVDWIDVNASQLP